jgi:ribonuclease-3
MSNNKDLSLPTEIANLSPDLYQQVFTHRSLRSRKIKKESTNERLEFLGDAVLELVVSEFIFKNYPKADEGKLTRYRAALVKTETLATVANQLHLADHLQANLSDKAEEKLPSLLADTFEAVIGGIYLQSGYLACQAFVKQYLLSQLKTLITDIDAKDPKSLLQEKLQANNLEAPEYEVIKEEGPDHNKIFTVKVIIPGKKPQKGVGPSKQKAEQAAATNALSRYFPD